MFFDLEKFRKCVAEFDDELVLEMAPAAITEIEYLRAGVATTALALRRLVGQDIPLTDAEREAIEAACKSVKMVGTEKCFTTLRGLLERTK